MRHPILIAALMGSALALSACQKGVSDAEAAKAIEPPKHKGGPLAEKPDYTAMLAAAHRRPRVGRFRRLRAGPYVPARGFQSR